MPLKGPEKSLPYTTVGKSSFKFIGFKLTNISLYKDVFGIRHDSTTAKGVGYIKGYNLEYSQDSTTETYCVAPWYS